MEHVLTPNLSHFDALSGTLDLHVILCICESIPTPNQIYPHLNNLQHVADK